MPRSVLADAADRDLPVFLLRPAPRKPAGRWSPPTPARWRRATAPGRRWPRRTACTASATWPNSRTPWNCSASPGARRAGAVSAQARGAARARHRARLRLRARPRRRPRRRGGVPFTPLTDATRERLAAVLDPGLEPGNRWTSGGPAATPRRCSPRRCPPSPTTRGRRGRARGRPGTRVRRRRLLPGRLLAAGVEDVKPVAVLASIPAAIDSGAASLPARFRRPGPRVTRTGLLALRAPARPRRIFTARARRTGRRSRARDRIRPAARGPPRAAGPPPSTAGPLPAADLFDLLRDYGVPAVPRPLGRHRGRGARRRCRDRLPGRDQDRRARASRTSPMWAASISTSRTRPASPPPTRTCPPASAPRHRLRDGRPRTRAHPRPGPRSGPRPAGRPRRRRRPGRVPRRARGRPPAALGRDAATMVPAAGAECRGVRGQPPCDAGRRWPSPSPPSRRWRPNWGVPRRLRRQPADLLPRASLAVDARPRRGRAARPRAASRDKSQSRCPI